MCVSRYIIILFGILPSFLNVRMIELIPSASKTPRFVYVPPKRHVPNKRKIRLPRSFNVAKIRARVRSSYVRAYNVERLSINGVNLCLQYVLVLLFRTISRLCRGLLASISHDLERGAGKCFSPLYTCNIFRKVTHLGFIS